MRVIAVADRKIHPDKQTSITKSEQCIQLCGFWDPRHVATPRANERAIRTHGRRFNTKPTLFQCGIHAFTSLRLLTIAPNNDYAIGAKKVEEPLEHRLQ